MSSWQNYIDLIKSGVYSSTHKSDCTRCKKAAYLLITHGDLRACLHCVVAIENLLNAIDMKTEAVILQPVHHIPTWGGGSFTSFGGPSPC